MNISNSSRIFKIREKKWRVVCFSTWHIETMITISTNVFTTISLYLSFLHFPFSRSPHFNIHAAFNKVHTQKKAKDTQENKNVATLNGVKEEKKFHPLLGRSALICVGRQRFVLQNKRSKGRYYYVKIVLVTLSSSIRKKISSLFLNALYRVYGERLNIMWHTILSLPGLSWESKILVCDDLLYHAEN